MFRLLGPLVFWRSGRRGRESLPAKLDSLVGRVARFLGLDRFL